MARTADAGATTEFLRGKQAQREETVALLKELRDELTKRENWSVKRATWTMAILAAEGKLDKGRKSMAEIKEQSEQLADEFEGQ